ncbi:unnamed protein product [marine sediment metagenome]|uniref:Uncharacterized protein n=1 Tax=marine sediment metagenome TaxID=412755 RepID=X0ZL39_9ZZZZ
MDMKVCNYRENAVIEWLPGVVDKKLPIYSDRYGYLSVGFTLYAQSQPFPTDTTRLEHAYVFLRTWNIDNNEAVVLISRGEHMRFEHISFDDLPELSKLINGKNLIYNNGGAQVLAP